MYVRDAEQNIGCDARMAIKNTNHLIVFYVVLVVLISYAIYFTSQQTYKDKTFRETCKKLCQDGEMDYEGVQEGYCVCNPHFYVRKYVNP